MLSADEGYRGRYESLTDPWFWIVAIPTGALLFWWDKRAERRRGRPFTQAERSKRRFAYGAVAVGAGILAGFLSDMWGAG